MSSELKVYDLNEVNENKEEDVSQGTRGQDPGRVNEAPNTNDSE